LKAVARQYCQWFWRTVRRVWNQYEEYVCKM
jgi:hypothetical protein